MAYTEANTVDGGYVTKAASPTLDALAALDTEIELLAKKLNVLYQRLEHVLLPDSPHVVAHDEPPEASDAASMTRARIQGARAEIRRLGSGVAQFTDRVDL